MRSRLTTRKDNNHKDIETDLITFWGGRFEDYSFVGGGHPDGLHATPHALTVVGRFSHEHALYVLETVPGIHRIFTGGNVYVEIKNPNSSHKLMKNQAEWIENHPGPAIVVATPDDVMRYGK